MIVTGEKTKSEYRTVRLESPLVVPAGQTSLLSKQVVFSVSQYRLALIAPVYEPVLDEFFQVRQHRPFGHSVRLW